MRQKVFEKVREDNGWRNMLQRSSLECPRCKQTWLILGVDKNHPYTCKACGHIFRIEAGQSTMKKAAGSER